MKAERVQSDVLVIGRGAAGCAAALEAQAQSARPLMVVKGRMRRVFVMARGFSAFLNLGETMYRDMEASGALVPLPVPGIELAGRLEA